MREVKLVASFNFKGTVSHKQYVTSFKMYNKCFYNIVFIFSKILYWLYGNRLYFTVTIVH